MTALSNTRDGAPVPEGGAMRSPATLEAFSAYALSLPALLLMTALILIPSIGVFIIAATDWQLGSKTFAFVGLRNFAELATDHTFRAALRNTLLYVAVTAPATMTAGLAVALLIESGRTFRSFYRATHFLPVMATLAAMAISWEALLHPTIGLVNQLLTGHGHAGPNWLRDPDLALPTLMVIGIWQNLGLAMVLFLAGLKAIPGELYDAAEVDGADGWFDRLLTVTLPGLAPVSMFVAIILALRGFEVFDTVRVLTQGGPGDASETLLHTLYVESFEFFRTGYGAAVTVVFLIIVVSLTLLQARLLDRRVHYA